ncbi:MAG TPA: PEP-CTERM sorting domain-containing protein, partial [Casimicrobiaceae bacterium]|nr:PEP-CTERM sorting domain-containing protein [Casimicrobiaceae bacterium]
PMKIRPLLIAAATAAMVSTSVSANPVLSLQSISPITMALPSPFPVVSPPGVVVADNGPGDSSAVDGAVVFIGPIDGYIINVTTGTGGPITPGATLDLNSVDVSSFGPGGSGALEIMFTENNLSAATGTNLLNFFSAIGGTTEGRISWWLYVDDGNSLFGLSQLVRMGTFTSTPGDLAFSEDASALRMITDTFSMTLRVVIEHGDGLRTTSFDFNGMTGRIPEPNTLLLIALGVLGFALIRRRA